MSVWRGKMFIAILKYALAKKKILHKIFFFNSVPSKYSFPSYLIAISFLEKCKATFSVTPKKWNKTSTIEYINNYYICMFSAFSWNFTVILFSRDYEQKHNILVLILVFLLLSFYFTIIRNLQPLFVLMF